jgi:hypothetical protein
MLSVCFVCLLRSWLLRLLPWITRSEVRGETSNSLYLLYFFRISSGRGGESSWKGSDGRLHHFHSPEEVDPLAARSGRLFQVLCPNVLILSMAISSYLLHPSNIGERVYSFKISVIRVSLLWSSSYAFDFGRRFLRWGKGGGEERSEGGGALFHSLCTSVYYLVS